MAKYKYHYTYWITNIINGKSYIGARSCNCKPEEDIEYMGSSKKYLDKAIEKEGLQNFDKHILAYWATRKEAIEHEILLHDIFDVGRNPVFYNGAKQTSTGFDSTGIPHISPKLSCSVCGLIGQTSNIVRWHNENCGKEIDTTGMHKPRKTKLTCDRCGFTGASGNMKRYHFENCENNVSRQYVLMCQANPDLAPITEKSCPHCGIIASPTNLRRWHFENCRPNRRWANKAMKNKHSTNK